MNAISLLRALALAVVIALAISPAHGQDDSDDGQGSEDESSEESSVSSVSWGRIGDLGGQYNVFRPDIEGRSFNAARIGFESDFNIGCSGIARGDIFNNLTSQITNQFSRLKSQAPGLAINYLIYSNPTLHNLIQQMNQSFEWLSQMTSIGCSSVRQIASNNRESVAKAREKCLEEGGGPMSCSGEGLQAQFDAVRQDLTNARRTAVQDARRASRKAARQLGMDPPEQQDDGEDGDDGDGSEDDTAVGGDVNALVVSATVPPGNFHPDDPMSFRSDVLAKVLPNISSGTADSGKSVEAAQKSIQDIIAERSQLYAEWWNATVQADIGGDDALPDDGVSDQQRPDGFHYLSRDPTVKRPTPKFVAQLKNLRRNNIGAYKTAIDVLATRQAIDYGDYMVDMVESAVLDASIYQKEDVLKPKHTEIYKTAIEKMRTQVDLYEKRFEAARKQSNIEQAIRDSAQ